MSKKEGLIRVIHRLATDEGFRHQLLITPREVLMAELGISGEVYDALLAVAPVILAGGLFMLRGGGAPDSDPSIEADWGGWYR